MRLREYSSKGFIFLGIHNQQQVRHLLEWNSCAGVLQVEQATGEDKEINTVQEGK